jgi:hypothetical protein
VRFGAQIADLPDDLAAGAELISQVWSTPTLNNPVIDTG